MAEDVQQFEIKAVKPDAWIDRSMTVFALPPTPESDMETNVVISRERLAAEDTFGAYIQKQTALMEQQIPQFDLVDARDGLIKGKKAHDIVCRWMSPAGRLQQRIVYLSVGMGQVITFAATASVSDFQAHKKAFSEILSSISVESI